MAKKAKTSKTHTGHKPTGSHPWVNKRFYPRRKKSRDAYAEGVEAAVSGRSGTTNPYATTSEEHLRWNDGWLSIQNT